MSFLPEIFSLLVLASGWYYLFYSPAAHRLSGVEEGSINRLRIRLRRVNAVVMMLLAVTFYAAVRTIPPRTKMLAWAFVTILLLLSAMLILALIDLQLTRRLRRRQKKDQP
jgi:hypothetical protein